MKSPDLFFGRGSEFFFEILASAHEKMIKKSKNPIKIFDGEKTWFETPNS